MKRVFILQPSTREDKKWMINEPSNDNFNTLHFGSAYHQSYPDHKNPIRKKLYIQRHKVRENWNKSGINTSGFWARWLLWNLPTIEDSIKDIEKRYDIKILI